MEPTRPENSITDVDEQDTFKQPNKYVVYASLVVVVLLSLVLIGSTGVRWMTQRMPSSILVFHANAQLAVGTVIYVSNESNHERTIHLTDSDDYTTPVFLEPGTYSLTAKHGGEVIFRDSMYVAQGSRYDIDITHPSLLP